MARKHITTITFYGLFLCLILLSEQGIAQAEAEIVTEGIEQAEEIVEENKDIDLDIDEHWAYAKINELIEAKVLPHSVQDQFEPDQRITKADLTQMILRAKGIQAPERALFSPGRFIDVSPELDAFPYIEVAYSMAIINDNQGAFHPLAAISREQAVTMIIRAMGQEEKVKQLAHAEQILQNYADHHQISPEYRNFIAFAIEQNMLKGEEEEGKMYIDPKSFTTKAEAAAMVARFILPESKNLQQTMVDGVNIFYHSKMEMEATAYSNEEPHLSDYTSIGLLVRHGIVSVNPEVIPYGTHLYIEGYGYAVAGDTGGSMLNNAQRIDLAFPTLSQAQQFGRKNVTVYFLHDRE